MAPTARSRVATTTQTRTARGTRAFARRLASRLEGGAVLALVGELGAGKTSFTQGLAEGLGVSDQSQVLSPTYTLVNEYPGGRLVLVHIDFYRLANAEAARGLGIDEQIGRADAVTAIEWADLFPELVPPSATWVRLSTVTEGRRIELTGP